MSIDDLNVVDCPNEHVHVVIPQWGLVPYLEGSTDLAI
jgi:hypothetical protein